MNETTMIRKFRILSTDHERILKVLDELPLGDFVRIAVLERLFKFWMIKNLDDDFQDLLMEMEKENNHHYTENGDFFAYFEDEDVENYITTYEEEFVDYFRDNKQLCYDM